MPMQGNPAQLNQPASVNNKVQRLKRLNISIAQLEEQLKTPFRHADSKAQAEAKLAKIKKEKATTIELLKAGKSEIDAVLSEA